MFNHNSILADNEPDWSTIDKTKLPKLAFANHTDSAKSSWTYPHHWVKGGTITDENGVWTDGVMYLHRGGLNAAWAAAQGARSSQKASQEVIDHLEAHRKAIGEDKPSAQSNPLIVNAQTLRALADKMHARIKK